MAAGGVAEADQWVGDVRRIVSNLPARMPVTYYPLDEPPATVQAPLIVTGPRGNVGRPELTDSRVAFNGGGWLDVGGKPQRMWCESFWLDPVLDTHVAYAELPGEPPDLLGRAPDERGWYFESCKTGQQQYDLAVTASLVRLSHRFPEGVEVSSDGGH